jgi:serine/threonine protein kinase
MHSGERVGGFIIERQLNVAGRRPCYLVRAAADGRRGFIQILGAAAPPAEAGLLRLRDLLAGIDHPNLVRVLGAGTCSAGLYFLTEYVEGKSLDEAVSLPLVWEVCEVGLQISRALTHLHGCKIVHGNLHPGRVLATAGRRLKLLYPDLSRMVRAVGRSAGPFVALRDWSASAGCGSPEQLAGQPVTPQTDLYLLGVLLYELLAGHSPHREVGFDKLHLLFARPVRSISERGVAVPVELDALITRLLEIDPRRRPQDAFEVADRLLRLSYSLSSSRQQDQRLSFSVTMTYVPLSKQKNPPRPARSRSWLGGIFGVTIEPAVGVARILWDLLASRRGRRTSGAGDLPPPPERGASQTPDEDLELYKELERVPPLRVPDRPVPARERWMYTDVSFPACVRVNKVYNLRVQLVPSEDTLPSGQVRRLPPPHPHDALLQLSAVSVPVPVGVSVAAEQFEIEGDPRAVIAVPPEGKSPAVSFRLRGVAVGRGRIMVDFDQGGLPVGSVDLSPEIVAAGRPETAAGEGAAVEVCLRAGRAGSRPDVVLKVFEQRLGGSAGRLRFLVASGKPELRDFPVLDGDLGTTDLRADTASWVGEQLRALGDLAGRERPAGESERTLAAIGCNLYDQLLPAGLKDLYWSLRDRRAGVRDVLILSDEPHIPWELIKPYRVDPATGDTEEGEFWGAEFALTRWLRGRPPAAQFSAQHVVAVAAGQTAGGPPGDARDMVLAGPSPAPPADAATAPVLPPLPCAGTELAVLRRLERVGARVRVLPARRDDLRAAFEEAGFDVLHVAAHGSLGAGDLDASAVLLDDGPFRAADLSPAQSAALRRSAPLIVFNLCHSGRLGFSLTRLGSWGARLVELGCGGFVGTLWQVTDAAALTFAAAFYDGWAAGVPIGPAVQRARLAVRSEHPGDPTWLAYCCFADPRAWLVKQLNRHEYE